MDRVPRDDTVPTNADARADGETTPPDGEDGRTFELPEGPERRYTRSGGVEYEGRVVFCLDPDPELPVDELEGLLADAFEDDRYVPCDWFDFPLPVYLVHDREVSTAFRVVVRTGGLELHVLPSTDPDGLRSLYRRLDAATANDWSVRREVDTSS